jgi:cytochrome c oxidase subunit II
MPPLRRSRRAPAIRALAAVVAVLAGCTSSPVTVEAGQVRGLYDIFLIAAAIVFVVVAGLIGWSIVRYRSRGSTELPVQTRTNLTLELIWWALPTALVIGLFIVSAQVLGQVDRTADPLVNVRVEAFQWQWRFTYEKQNVVITGVPGKPPELVLPVGERIGLELVSDDVIHAFFVPRFLVKRDLVPGITNHLDLTINAEGTYSGQCAEFCGLLHDRMLFSVRAVSPAEFATWLAAQQKAMGADQP